MDRGAWQATVHGVARVRHDLVTEQQQRQILFQEEKWGVEKLGRAPSGREAKKAGNQECSSSPGAT